MSTTPPALPQTDEEVAAYIRQIAAEEARKASGQTAPPAETPATPPAQTGFKMNIAGNEYSFTTPEEASAAMNNLLLQQQQLREQQNNQGRKVTSDETPAFDMKTYVDKMASNPMDAAEYLDEARFGVKNPSQVFKSMMQKQQEQEQQNAMLARELASYQFIQTHPDYIVSTENANAIDQMVKQHQLPWTPQGLEAAYLIAKQKGLMKAEEAPAPQAPVYTPQTQAPYNPYTAAPPVASRTPTAESVPGWASDVDGLSLEQIETIMKRFQS